MAKPTAPTAGERLKASILEWRPQGDVEPMIFGPGERLVLDAAAGVADTIERLEHASADAPPFVDGPGGRVVIHPVHSELRSQRVALATLLSRLHLPESGENDEKLTASQRARKAARARWS